MIIDTHAHYDDEAFDPDREVLLASMQEHGIEKLVNVCASIDGLQDTVKLIEKYPFIYGAVGVHPDDAEPVSYTHLFCMMYIFSLHLRVDVLSPTIM